jgi:glycosyltransferase involved in cell wall biosynthesis
MRAYGNVVRDPVALHHVPSYRPGYRNPTRAAAVASARIMPGRTSRDVPADLDVLHYPVTVPIPDTSLPRIVTIHGLQHLERPDLFSPLTRRYRRWAYDDAARRADIVIVVSRHVRRSVIERLGVDPGRVEVIPLGIDFDHFTPVASRDDDRLLAELQLPDRFVLYPANLWAHKNHDLLIRALAAQDDQSLALVLVGQTYGRLRALFAAASKLGIEDRVHHLGFVQREAMPALYRRARAAIFPSLAEGFGAPPLEAIASGCPVAASTSGALAETCGEAVLPLDPEDCDSVESALSRITQDEALRARLRTVGTEQVARFSWTEAARRHRAVYAKAAESRRVQGARALALAIAAPLSSGLVRD